MKFKLQTVPPAQGLEWVRSGLRELRRRPWSYMSLLLAFMTALVLASLLPGGALWVMLSVPLLSLAFMMATRASLNGHTPGLGVFVAPWAPRHRRLRQPLMILCLVYALLSWFTMALGAWIDGGAFAELITALNDPRSTQAQIDQLSNAPGLFSGIVVRLSLTALIGVPLWHPPALIVWGRHSAGQALFSSTLALWQARSAFVVYGLGWLGVVLAAMGLSSFITAMLGTGTLGSLLVMITGLAVTSAYYASQFFSFQDCFAAEPDPPATSASNTAQGE
jgi:MFS family permease